MPPDADPAHRDKLTQLAVLLRAMAVQHGEMSLKELVNQTVALVERQSIISALASTAGNRSAAAKILGLSRQSLYAKLSRYGIDDGAFG